MPRKYKDNEAALKGFIKDAAWNAHLLALTRERLLKMVDLTRQSIRENPTAFDNPLYHHTHYLAWCDKVEEHLGFEEDKPAYDNTKQNPMESMQEYFDRAKREGFDPLKD